MKAQLIIQQKSLGITISDSKKTLEQIDDAIKEFT